MKHFARTIPYESLIGALKEREGQGLVHSQRLDGHNITIWTYTRQCVYEKKWDTFTMAARGLILDEFARYVVATPFPKFFNYGEAVGQDGGIPDLPFETFEKLDGSLIILFFYKDHWRCATKGSFTSPQARLAQQIIDNQWAPLTPMASSLNTNHTYLFELIGPDNRIVIRYPESVLVLLGGYNMAGEEYPFDQLQIVAQREGFHLVHRYSSYQHLSDLIVQQPTLPADREGFVVRFANGHRLKIKGDEYCRIHRVISGITPLNLWAAMRDKTDMVTLRQDVPEEFWPDFDSIHSILLGQLNYLIEHAKAEALAVSHWSDKELGLRIKTIPARVQGLVFAVRKTPDLLSNHKSRHHLFQDIRPKHNHLSGYRPSTSMVRVHEEEAS